MKQIKIALVCAGLLPGAVISAQEQKKDSTLNRTVVVENQYNPEVMDAFKVNVLPKVEEPAVAKKNIDYATSLRPLTSWTVRPMVIWSGKKLLGDIFAELMEAGTMQI